MKILYLSSYKLTDELKDNGIIAPPNELLSYLNFDYRPTMKDLIIRAAAISQYCNHNNHFNVLIDVPSYFIPFLDMALRAAMIIPYYSFCDPITKSHKELFKYESIQIKQ